MRITIAVAALVLLLAGCATPTPQPTASPTASPSPTPTPTPTQAAEPWSTVPLDCDAFLADVDAQTLTQSADVALNDEWAGDITRIAARQGGALICTWSDGHFLGSEASAPAVMIDVLAGGAEQYRASQWSYSGQAVTYPDGADSAYACVTGLEGQSYCEFELLVGDYAAKGTFLNAYGTTVDADASMRTIIDAVSAALATAADALEPWVVPEGVLTGAMCAGRTSLDPGAYFLIGDAAARTPLVSCESTAGPPVEVLPGGAWAIAAAEGAYGGYKTPSLAWADIPGVGPALVTCGFGCSALLDVGGSAVSIYADRDRATTLEMFTPYLQEITAELLSAG